MPKVEHQDATVLSDDELRTLDAHWRAANVRHEEEADAMAVPLVVGIDGSEASLEAVDWAADEALLHDVPLHLLHAVAPDHDASDLVAAASERARKSAPGVRLSSEVLSEDAASALVSDGRNALALVLGSRGLGGLAGLLLGSVSLAVPARADCPVVVVRGGVEPRRGEFGCVVVGVEDGEGSGRAVEFAFREAHVRRCRILAVHAWSVPVGNPGPPGLSGYALQALDRPPAQVLADALRGPEQRYPDVTVTSEVVEGSARQALLNAASGADLLVVGPRRRHGTSVCSWAWSTMRCYITRRVRSRSFRRYEIAVVPQI